MIMLASGIRLAWLVYCFLLLSASRVCPCGILYPVCDEVYLLLPAAMAMVSLNIPSEGVNRDCRHTLDVMLSFPAARSYSRPDPPVSPHRYLRF